MKSTDPLRNVNLKCPFPDLNGPPMSVEDWASTVFEVEAKTVLEWVNKHRIRHKKYGRTSMIRPLDMWDCVPYENSDATPEPDPKPKKRSA